MIQNFLRDPPQIVDTPTAGKRAKEKAQPARTKTTTGERPDFVTVRSLHK
jgi:hypothetical protein